MIAHHITHVIFNNSDNNLNAQTDCVFLSFLKKVEFCLQMIEIKNENVDCEVYKKPDVIQFVSQATEKLPRSNNNDLLDVQYLHST